MAVTFGKKLSPPMPKRSNTDISRKTKSCRQYVLFLWPVKLMLWISNLFLNLIEVTHFQKHIDGLLTDMQIQRQNILPCKKQLRIHSFNIPFLYAILSYQTDAYLKKCSWKSIFFFLKKWYNIDILQLSNKYVKNWCIY